MRTFLHVLGFELRFYLKRVSTWVYFGIYFAVTHFWAAAIGGAIKGAQVGIGGAGGVVHSNSPYIIALVVIAPMSFFGIITIAAISGNAVYRDFEAEIHPLFFTTPVSRVSYLGGRYVGSIIVNAIVLAGIPLGAATAFLMPYVDHDKLGAFMPWSYVQPFLIIVVPNIIFAGAIFLALAAFTRQMLPNYLGGVILLIGYLIASVLLGEPEKETLSSLLDPFGFNAMGFAVRYWTAAEKNTLLVPLTGLLLENRVLWTGLGLGVFGLVFRFFRFQHLVTERVKRRTHVVALEEWAANVGATARRTSVPAVMRRFDAGARWKQLVASTWRAFAGIVTNVYFFAIVGAGILFLAFMSGEVGKLYGTHAWPVTYGVIEVLGGIFGLFTLIVVTFYAGELVWRERDARVAQVHDALPIPTWLPLVSKFLALVMVVTVLQGVLTLSGMVTQAAKGYFRFELDQYAISLFGIGLIQWVEMCALVMLIHVLVNNKYVGYLICVLFFIGRGFLPRLGLEHVLEIYGSDTGWMYSDMNRYGPFLGPWAWLKLYWGLWAVLLALASNLLWVRGQETAFSWRMRMARARMSGPIRIVAALAVLGILGVGGFIFYNTNVLNTFRTGYQSEELQARYERDYKQYENLPQPRIVVSTVDVDLFPKRGEAAAKGEYELVNKTSTAIETLHVQVPAEAKVRALEFDPPAALEKDDADLGYRIYRLAAPLQPGAPLTCRYELSYEKHGFDNDGPDTFVVENGTFINSGVLPSFGYSENGELSDNDTRKKHGLPLKERMRKVDDPIGRQNNYISRDADWVDFKCTVCTDPDQLAIAPGYLKEELTRDGRRCFRYEMDAPILHFEAFLSARYAVAKDAWNDVAIEVWYHPTHAWNVPRMIQAVKDSLDYYTKNFGPYQHRQVRIVEFPRYAQFAQSFPNMIPYSESVGFIARVKDKVKDVDFAYYVTAHEVAHQWWAHQVIGGNVQGSTLMSESLAQYSALMVMEHEYGPEQMRKFLWYELDRYLQGRAAERHKELPLELVENQQYIHYNKASLVFYALKDYIGEDTLNQGIRNFLAKTKFQQPPYTNSLEFVQEIRAVTPPEQQYLIEDLFETITLWDLRAKEATVVKTAEGKYELTLEIEAKKLRADETGTETEIPLDMPIDVGAFLQGKSSESFDDEPILVEKQRIVSGKNVVKLLLDKKPERAGIDPYNKLIDRDPADNIIAVKDAPSS
jgi:hypothetical protein